MNVETEEQDQDYSPTSRGDDDRAEDGDDLAEQFGFGNEDDARAKADDRIAPEQAPRARGAPLVCEPCDSRIHETLERGCGGTLRIALAASMLVSSVR